MVASFRAIRAYSKKKKKPFTGAYYTAHRYENYVTLGGARLGEWCGAGCGYMGLGLAVLPVHFERLLHRKDPHSDKDLFQRKRPLSEAELLKVREHQLACLDITFSPDKSHSAYLVYATEQVRRRYERIMLDAARETLETAEAMLPLGRRGKLGHERLMAKMIGALFLDRANRNGEPCWHIHSPIMSMVKTEHGWSIINSKMLRDWTRALGPVFRANLAYKLKQELGLELEDVLDQDGNKRGWARLAGVPLDLCDGWSSRAHEIHDETQQYKAGVEPSAKSKATAAILTRGKKQPLPPENEFIAKHQADGARYGFNTAQAMELLGRSKTVATEKDYKGAFKKAVETLATSEGHFTHAQVVQAVAEDLQALGMPAKELMRRVAHDLSHSQDLKLLNPTPGDSRYTTREMWELEESSDQCAVVLAVTKGPQISTHAIERALARRKDLSAEQADAVRYMLGSESSLKVVTGIAGAGKSRSLDLVREVLETHGKHVAGAAVSGNAKEELAEKANIPSRTVASWLFHLELTPKQRAKRAIRHHARQLARAAKGKRTYRQSQVKLKTNSVLIVDEAGMLDTAAGCRLLRQVEKAGASIILVGDDEQIQSINAGGMLGHLAKKFDHFHMKENWRQLDTRDQIATELLREGKGALAIEDMSKRRRVHTAETRIQAMDDLVSTVAASGGLTNPKAHVCFTMTRMEARLVNQKIQAARLAANAIDAKRFVSFGSEKLHVGDRVLVHEPLRQYGLENGYRGTVLSVDKLRRTVDVRFDQRVKLFGNRTLPGNVVTIPLRKLPAESLSLSYAMTISKGQGLTCEYAYVLVGGRMTDKQLTYTQLTRARRKTHVFVDKLHAGPHLEDLSASVSRSRKKKLAHDMVVKTKTIEKTHQHEHNPY